MKILTLKEKPKKENPIIEIMGPIDIGKTLIAQLVARRLNATLFAFPILDPYSMTGRGLLAALSQTPRGLESNPYWWSHIYAANMYEQKEKIKEALEKHQPKIVVFSWMPYGKDYTDDFRATESVEEYILIGETAGGCCGSDWNTWGYSGGDTAANEVNMAPYTTDGFGLEELTDISEKQICRTDLLECTHSHTMSFKRTK